MAFNTVLGLWPSLLFGILEPIFMAVGGYTAISDPERWHRDQIPPHALSLFQGLKPMSPASKIIIMQSGNVFLLLSLIAILCTFFVTPKVAKLYTLFLSFGDLGHIATVYFGLGPDVFWDVSRWNDMIWGHVALSSFYFVNRVLTVIGVFDKAPPSLKGKKKV